MYIEMCVYVCNEYEHDDYVKIVAVVVAFYKFPNTNFTNSCCCMPKI